jgi:hypothetical protein
VQGLLGELDRFIDGMVTVPWLMPHHEQVKAAWIDVQPELRLLEDQASRSSTDFLRARGLADAQLAMKVAQFNGIRAQMPADMTSLAQSGKSSTVVATVTKGGSALLSVGKEVAESAMEDAPGGHLVLEFLGVSAEVLGSAELLRRPAMIVWDGTRWVVGGLAGRATDAGDKIITGARELGGVGADAAKSLPGRLAKKLPRRRRK